jgi:hypothetical protein
MDGYMAAILPDTAAFPPQPENQLSITVRAGLLVHVGISDIGTDHCGLHITHRGVFMFHVQRLSGRLASHAVGMRVALFAFGRELKPSCVITTRRSRT